MHNFIIPQFVDIIERAIAWFRFNPWPPVVVLGGGGRRPPRGIITAINVFADLYVLLSGRIPVLCAVICSLSSAVSLPPRWLLHSALAGSLPLPVFLYTLVSFPRFYPVGDCKLNLISPRLWVDSFLFVHSWVLCYRDSCWLECFVRPRKHRSFVCLL